jgi:hypothetical protein
MARLPDALRGSKILSIPVILTSALLVIVFFFVPRSTADPDIWWHLRDAQVLLSSHTLITRDLYSFTAFGSPWMNHEWIAELPFYLGWHLAGDSGVYWVKVIAIELNILGVLTLAWLHSRNLKASILVAVIATILATISFGPRTLLFGWLCLLIELILLLESERKPRLLWALPLLFALWVNTHGSWMIGMVLLIIYIAASSYSFQCGWLECKGLPAEHLRRLFLTTGLSALALFLNPYGWRLVAYPFNLAFHQKLNVANVEEWRSVDFHSPRGLTALACLVSLAVWQLCRPRRWSICEVMFLCIGIYSAFNYSRFLFLFAILVAPILAKSFGQANSKVERRPRLLLNGAILFTLLCFVIGRVRGEEHVDEPAKKLYPTEALPFLASFHPQGRVFNDYLWGGYMIWNLRGWPVFIDSRADIFEYNGTFKDYLDIIRIKNSLGLLDKYKIRYVLYEKDSPLVYLLQHAGGWATDYQDERVILLERVTSVPGANR